jgi:hypothetical protein
MAGKKKQVKAAPKKEAKKTRQCGKKVTETKPLMCQ